MYLGLGSNLGNREQAIYDAIELLGRQAGDVEAQSALYYSEPWGFQSANAFANAVVRLTTPLSPHKLLRVTQSIERQMGKTARHATERPATVPEASASGGSAPVPLALASGESAPVYHDRPIDIDILLYDDLTIDTPDLKIPHPLMRQRPFVMEPLRQIMTDL